MKGYNNQPVANSSEEIASSSNKSIRLFKVARNISDVPVEDTKGSWVECTPDTVKDFSATGHYFGRKINKETQYPVGLICSSWGGTLAQAWTRLDFIKYDDSLNPVIDYYNTNLEKWEKACLEAGSEKPYRRAGIRANDESGVLYNEMIAPITNMTIRGTIWYQGESNTNDAYRYRDLFTTMIDNWRCDFKNYQMPFYFVQLASFTDQKPGQQVEPYRGQPRDHSWAELREAQYL